MSNPTPSSLLPTWIWLTKLATSALCLLLLLAGVIVSLNLGAKHALFWLPVALGGAAGAALFYAQSARLRKLERALLAGDTAVIEAWHARESARKALRLELATRMVQREAERAASQPEPEETPESGETGWDKANSISAKSSCKRG